MSYTTEEKLDYVLGQLRGVSATAQVLVAVRPDADKLLAHISNLLHRMESESLFVATTDAYAEGLSEFRTNLQKVVSIFAEHKKDGPI